MAINPNTDFSSGAVLTADQQNRFPRGIVAQTSSTTGDTNITSTNKVVLTASSFTAVANRYYKITYYEPSAQPSTGVQNYITLQIRKTNATGTVYGQGQYQMETNNAVSGSVTVVALTTFTAGSVTIVGTASVNGGTGSVNRSGDAVAYLIVEDVGPA